MHTRLRRSHLENRVPSVNMCSFDILQPEKYHKLNRDKMHY